MCECGCTSGNDLYRLPGPKGSVYLITLSCACVSCDGPTGVSIEKFVSTKALKTYCWELPKELLLEKWPESLGAAIVTGYRKHEFVKALSNGLIRLNSNDFADKPGEGLDKIAAETILEDLYEDSWITPFVVEKKND